MVKAPFLGIGVYSWLSIRVLYLGVLRAMQGLRQPWLGFSLKDEAGEGNWLEAQLFPSVPSRQYCNGLELPHQVPSVSRGHIYSTWHIVGTLQTQ